MTLIVPTPHETFDLTMADGAPIRIRRHGNPKGPRLVLCHGNGFAIDAYVPFWSLLADRFDLVLYDQRNHGQNPLYKPEAHDVPRFVRSAYFTQSRESRRSGMPCNTVSAGTHSYCLIPR
jgi:pimeloyl-ACP methyl ester carboxylesterase